MKFPRITADPNQMGGEPCIRGLPISVEAVVDLIGDGMRVAEIVARHPDLTPEDVLEAVQYQLCVVRLHSAVVEAALMELDNGAATNRSLAPFVREHGTSAEEEAG